MFVDLLYKYFVATFIVGTGFFIGFKIVDNYVYQPMIKESEEDTEYAGLTEEEILVKKYNKSYLEDYSDLEINDMNENDLRKLQKCFLIEETPLGVVKMYYCCDNESFIYWSEKQVPYKVLETVSRKYVIDYDCKFIYVDMDYELNKKREELMDKIDASKQVSDMSGNDMSGNDMSGNDASVSDNNSVFVTFKKYNAANSKESIEKENKSKKPKENVIVCDKANRYSYRGVYNPDQDQKISLSTNNDTKKMSVQDFLNAQKKFTAMENLENNNSSSDGFWRFLDMKFIKNSNNDLDDGSDNGSDDGSDDELDDKKINIIGGGGQYSINNEIFTDRDKYHKRVMEELTNYVKHNDNSSDNSFDLMECDVDKDEKREVLNLDSAVESGLTRRRSASYCEESVTEKDGLDDKKSNSWLW